MSWPSFCHICKRLFFNMVTRRFCNKEVISLDVRGPIMITRNIPHIAVLSYIGCLIILVCVYVCPCDSVTCFSASVYLFICVCKNVWVCVSVSGYVCFWACVYMWHTCVWEWALGCMLVCGCVYANGRRKHPHSVLPVVWTVLLSKELQPHQLFIPLSGLIVCRIYDCILFKLRNFPFTSSIFGIKDSLVTWRLNIL